MFRCGAGGNVKRILVVLEAGDAWPSGWVRALVYRDLFREKGYEVTYVSRRWAWLMRMQWGRNRVLGRLSQRGFDKVLGGLARLAAVLREPWIVRMAARYDVVYLAKVSSLRLVRRLRRRTRARLVYDLNDAVWLPSWRGYERAIGEILGSVDAVTCDNVHGVEYARRHNRNSFVVPDPPQIELFDRYRSQRPARDGGLVLGWLGSPSTVFSLYAIWEPLERLFGRHADLHLRLVGVGHDPRLLPRFEKVRWSTVPHYTRHEMVAEVLAMDIGLYPMFDVEDSLARGILKATVYMSGGVAVVCSGVGQCRDLISDGVNGMLANSADEWFQKLERLVVDPELRRAIGARGLETARREYSLPCCFESLSRVLCPATAAEGAARA